MTAPLADLARQFRFNENLLQMLTQDFEADDWSRSPAADNGNNAHWVLGHLAGSRRAIVRRLGASVAQADWEPAFGMGVSPEGCAGYPDPDDLRRDFAQSGEALEGALADLGPDAVGQDFKPDGGGFPDGSSTLEGGMHFLFFHESYHLGQLGLLRRMVGRPGFA